MLCNNVLPARGFHWTTASSSSSSSVGSAPYFVADMCMSSASRDPAGWRERAAAAVPKAHSAMAATLHAKPAPPTCPPGNRMPQAMAAPIAPAMAAPAPVIAAEPCLAYKEQAHAANARNADRAAAARTMWTEAQGKSSARSAQRLPQVLYMAERGILAQSKPPARCECHSQSPSLQQRPSAFLHQVPSRHWSDDVQCSPCSTCLSAKWLAILDHRL
mmetsp:Transcript_100938/g.290260  ORF Transcript_100938/g.290260 Transcript_100938/m.290260 type:complete len:217 (-) Transcript_100938:223-873(-)